MPDFFSTGPTGTSLYSSPATLAAILASLASASPAPATAATAPAASSSPTAISSPGGSAGSPGGAQFGPAADPAQSFANANVAAQPNLGNALMHGIGIATGGAQAPLQMLGSLGASALFGNPTQNLLGGALAFNPPGPTLPASDTAQLAGTTPNANLTPGNILAQVIAQQNLLATMRALANAQAQGGGFSLNNATNAPGMNAIGSGVAPGAPVGSLGNLNAGAQAATAAMGGMGNANGSAGAMAGGGAASSGAGSAAGGGGGSYGGGSLGGGPGAQGAGGNPGGPPGGQ